MKKNVSKFFAISILQNGISFIYDKKTKKITLVFD